MFKTNPKKSDEVKTLKELILMLNANSHIIRIEAIQVLATGRYPEGADMLIEVIERDQEQIVRETAVIGLYFLESERVFETLKAVYFNPNEKAKVKARAIWALRKIKKQESCEIIFSALTHQNEEVQYWAVDSLSEIICENIPREKLVHILKTAKSTTLRQNVARIIVEKQANEFIPALSTSLVKDPNPAVRLACAWAIRLLNDPHSIKILYAALSNEFNILVKRELVKGISYLLDYRKFTTEEDKKLHSQLRSKAIPHLTKLMERETEPIVRRNCAEAFRKINDKSVVPFLVEIFPVETNQFVRREIIKTFGYLGDEEALKVLKKAKRSHYKYIANAAYLAIQSIKESNQ
ncbi:MAG: HEAT repeat domain-containing protein [Candidatus Heimdallarchaeota archaeon]